MRTCRLLDDARYCFIRVESVYPCNYKKHTELSSDVEAITTLLEQGDVEQQNDSLSFNTRVGMRVARFLQNLDPAKRWRLIGSVWVDILMCAAASNKPIEQLWHLTLGGEFLTHLWVLLVYLGCGDQ
ncbi:hypothetical protein L7F22_025521 [Adiantum nelumboides]|nr:hypothetical protein [Adiantum nelumboides]